MPIVPLYSKRRKKLRGEVPDVYQYEEFPHSFRVQVVHIWRDAVGTFFGDEQGPADRTFQVIHHTLCREYGKFTLRESREDVFASVANFMLELRDAEQVLDVIELSFQTIETFARESPHGYCEAKVNPENAIAELNERFQEHRIGFHYVSGELIRIDSKLIHSAVVKPALRLLHDRHYMGANEEFLSAHEHYRHKRYKECLNECLKSFESTMKALCKKRGWTFAENDTAKALVDICLSHGLIPAFWQSHFTGVRATLESGVPTARNRTSGHGQGPDLKTVPQSLAAYVLHLTATTILFLVEAERELP